MHIRSVFRLLSATFCLFAIAPAWADAVTTKVLEFKDIRYGRAGGQDLLLDAFVPEDGETSKSLTRAAIMFVHGGGWAAGSKEAFHQAARWFAQRGFVTYSVGYRLVKPDKNKWPSQLEDVQLAVRWIRDNAGKYSVDPQRVGAMGGSAGGHLVAMLALVDTGTTDGIPFGRHSSKVTCCVNWAGPADLTTTFPNSVKPIGLNVQKLVDDLLGATGEEAKDVARSASPLFHVSKDASPMLVVHGALDEVVPLDHSNRLVAALRTAGTDVELFVLPDEGHGLRPDNLQKVLNRTLKFFKHHLKPGN